MSWGDEDDGKNSAFARFGKSDLVEEKKLPPKTESKPDENGHITIIEYRWKDEEQTQMVKITKVVKRKYKSKNVLKIVVAREKKFKKFGRCKGVPMGVHEANVTYLHRDNINLDLRTRSIDQDDEKRDTGISNLKCTICSGGHLSLDCPNRDSFMKKQNLYSFNKFQPQEQSEQEIRTIKISELCEGVSQQDLQELCGTCGRVERVTIPKDHVTQKARGYAFVQFSTRSAAELAVERLNGHGYDDMILSVSWAKPRVNNGNNHVNRPPRQPRNTGGFNRHLFR